MVVVTIEEPSSAWIINNKSTQNVKNYQNNQTNDGSKEVQNEILIIGGRALSFDIISTLEDE